MGEMPLFGGQPVASLRSLIVAAATATVCLMAASGAQAAPVTISTITAPADGSLLLLNGTTAPSQTFTVSGTTNGTTGAVDIDCYNGGAVVMASGNPVRYQGSGSGIAVNSDGSFGAAVPLAALAGFGCELVAVPHGTTPSPPTGFTGPRVGISSFSTTSLSSGPNAGHTYDFAFTGATTIGSASVGSSGACGPAMSLYDGSAAMNSGPLLLSCADSLYGYSAFFTSATSPDLTRSEIVVDGQNAYGANPAANLNAASPNPSSSNPGLPPLTATLDAFSASTGAAQTTESEGLVKCSPSDVFNPSKAQCSSFAPSGVSFRRVTDLSADGRIETVIDTYSSADGAVHALDVQYETDLASTAAGWALPGQSSFAGHATGETAGGPPSATGTIYAIYSAAAAPSLTNPVAAMTFSSPYTSITFDNTLWSAFTPPKVSALVDYQRTVPAGGSVSIQWSNATGASLGEVEGEAADAQDAFAPPAISIASPASGATVTGTPVTVTGIASAGSGLRAVTVDGVTAALTGGAFAAAVPLSVGANTITATVTSNAGAVKSASETVTHGAPLASTGSASRIGSSTARLSGKLTPGGATASSSFLYGKTRKYGHRTRARSLAAGTKAVSVSATVSRLSPHATYHYRLVATGSAGTSSGADRTFKTLRALKRLTAHISPHHARRAPYHFRVSGSLTLPRGLSRRQGCKGTVSMLAKHGAKKVSSRTVKVTKRCTYSGAATIRARKLKGHGTLTFTVTFNGNRSLGALTAKAVDARFG